jgi:hypothetical protein
MDDLEVALQAERDRLSACVVVDLEMARPVWFAWRGTCWHCGAVAIHVVHQAGPRDHLECHECGMGAVSLHDAAGDEVDE